MHPLEIYLRDLRDFRATGATVPETSYYAPLANLLNAIGHDLKPRVRCVINLANRGAGIPDGGLFTEDQLQRGQEPLQGALPSRGAIEVKPTSNDALASPPNPRLMARPFRVQFLDINSSSHSSEA